MDNCVAFGGGYLRNEQGAAKHEPIRYDVAAVMEAAEAYIEARRSFLEIARLYVGRTMTDKESGIYWKRDAESDGAWDTLRLVCKTVGADPNAVLAIVRSFRRYSQYQRGWDFVAEWHMGERERDGFRRCVQA
jgi:hypothetical protein